MIKIQKDLLRISQSKGFKTFDEVRGYAYELKKYDGLSFRMIDEIVQVLNQPQRPVVINAKLVPVDPKTKDENYVTLK